METVTEHVLSADCPCEPVVEAPVEEKPTYMEQQAARPLWKTLRRYHHLERLGNLEVEGLLDQPEVIVTEKVDGANLTVAWDDEDGLIIASRNQAIWAKGAMLKNFNGASEHIQKDLPGLVEYVKQTGAVVRGEWMVRHTILYSEHVYGKFIAFDVENKEGEFVHPDAWVPHLKAVGCLVVPELGRFVGPVDAETISALSQGESLVGGKEREGCVVKAYGYKNRHGRTTWGKVVSADFKERAAAKFGANRFESREAKFVADCVTSSLVHKILDKIKDEKGEVTVRDMSRLISTAWFDAFQEELYSFVKKQKIKTFDFGYARKLSDEKVRGIGLSFFNGTPSVERFEKPDAS